MKPNRIYNNVLGHFGHQEGESPVLRQVQTFAGHFRRSALNETDFVDDMMKLAKRTRFTLDMQEGVALTFGYATNADGSPAIGEGVDDDPTIVGMSTPYMMKMLRLRRATYFISTQRTGWTYPDILFSLLVSLTTPVLFIRWHCL
ncbi:hypothetical protein JG687_00017250 [Phytophthora cactorum]|uniref:Uncharacterized protein n=1 Tax=Phytophthora cactorum TaxID=29920 RepID=A0A8T1TSI2_9STRA|nr:hypothetical protein PC120_g25813 [Phytophthora cactorum]KAG3082762.1 hypothetical protein PC121_g5979 [Phytophthora cactorum]KAG3134086.1 hypothetical protein PC128_g26254 [Phytophthora cactorum]KAG4038227.1 hypothetical protein PC123_g26210 [Phytophthora cactorum]KAG6945525.1 hypothetical protein JG687_00017250 [Phytophthora cactorum]